MLRSILNRHQFFLVFFTLLIASVNTAIAQSTVFTYQGRLTDNNLYPDGVYDFEFRLFNALTDGTQDIAPIQRLNVEVTGGAFTVLLDFGAGSFPGADRFLEIGVRQAGGSEFTTLTPRQQIMVTPYAIRSYATGYADYAVIANKARRGCGATRRHSGQSIRSNKRPTFVATPRQFSLYSKLHDATSNQQFQHQREWHGGRNAHGQYCQRDDAIQHRRCARVEQPGVVQLFCR